MKQLISLVLALLLFNSCKKDTANEETKVKKNEANWNVTATNVAKDVSEKLKSLAFRKMLKHEVCLRFDGDANILISSLINRMPKYLKYEKENQNSNLISNNDLLASFNFDILANAAIDFPQMQIAVQTDAESWDAISFIPKVVYINTTFDESISTSVNGFDNNQNPISVSTLDFFHNSHRWIIL
jgi:PBP1b-binding outer membrane lipoprotein LpoB